MRDLRRFKSDVDSKSRPAVWLRLAGAKLWAWVKNWANDWAAAAAYDDLSRLSDTELKHRSLTRDILSRDLNEGRDRAVRQLGSPPRASVIYSGPLPSCGRRELHLGRRLDLRPL